MLLILGFGIFVGWTLLLLRNQTGVFPIVPFASLVIIAIGALIIGLRVGSRFDPVGQLAATRAT